MLIVSWNIDGTSKPKIDRLLYLVAKDSPDIVFLNETKTKIEVLEPLFKSAFPAYDFLFNPHRPSNMHGIVMMIKKELKELTDYTWSTYDLSFSIPVRSDNKSINKDSKCGRILAIKLFSSNLKDIIYIIATYTPNSGVDPFNPLKNLAYRVDIWDKEFFNSIKKIKEDEPNAEIIWIGDINVALHDIDVFNPKKCFNRAGFTLEERNSINTFLQETNFVDIWRLQHPTEQRFTYKGYKPSSQRLRLDNCIISPNLVAKIKESKIYNDSDFCESDHNPISIVLE